MCARRVPANHEPACPDARRMALGPAIRHVLGPRLARRVGLSELKMREAAVERFLRRYGVTMVLGEFLDDFLDFVPLLDRMVLPYVVQGHGIDLSAALRKPGMASDTLVISPHAPS